MNCKSDFHDWSYMKRMLIDDENTDAESGYIFEFYSGSDFIGYLRTYAWAHGKLWMRLYLVQEPEFATMFRTNNNFAKSWIKDIDDALANKDYYFEDMDCIDLGTFDDISYRFINMHIPEDIYRCI